ncbi:hypothetical protein FQN60_007457 [Etheostoma spectabile]|uniref:Uncharacterized protein n=1 Tax=Etheostoma spectabile TaxID=54343 RepID=A0A5J5CTV5_9PERO|nr:hypothetical protein FQN60_007457 [Etheostoma spectabile]
MLVPPDPNDDRRVEFVALTAVHTERSEPSSPERGHPSHRTERQGRCSEVPRSDATASKTELD